MPAHAESLVRISHYVFFIVTGTEHMTKAHQERRAWGRHLGTPQSSRDRPIPLRQASKWATSCGDWDLRKAGGHCVCASW